MAIQPPTGLIAATADDGTSIILHWEPVATAVGYDIERDGVLIAELWPDLSFLDTDVQVGEQYSYRVRTVGAGTGASSFVAATVHEFEAVLGVGALKAKVIPAVAETGSAIGPINVIKGGVSGINAPAPPSSEPEMENFLNGVPNGSTVNFTAGGHYIFDGIITVSNKVGLTLNGNGCLFESIYEPTAPPVNGVLPRLNRDIFIARSWSGNWAIDNFEYQGRTGGGNPINEAYGFMFRNCVDGTISRLKAILMRDDGIWIGHLGTEPNRGQCHRLVVENCNLLQNRRHNLSIVHATDITVRGTNFDKTGTTSGTNIDMEPLSAGDFVANITVENNIFRFYPPSTERRSIQCNGSPSAWVQDVTVRNNTSVDKEFGVIVNNNNGGYDSGFRNFTVQNNVSDPNVACGVAPFRFNKTDTISVTGNRANLAPGVGFTSFSACTNTSASGNVDTSP